MSRIVIVGLGYVGLPLAVRAAEMGHHVIGLDTDRKKLMSLRNSVSPIEDVSDERLSAVWKSNNFIPMQAWSPDDRSSRQKIGFDLAIIAVPTPMRGKLPDLSYVEAAGRIIGHVLQFGTAVVLESTTYPGTTEGLLKDILEEESGLLAGRDFHLGFSPERIDPGSTKYTLENTPKLVSATTPEGLKMIQGFYDSIVERTVPVSSPKIAEMTKLFENIQANVNIALINEMAEICHDLDIDVHEMIEASMTKGHSMARWVPGPGTGGHCLPIDPLYLSWLTETKLGRPFRFGNLADSVNKSRPNYVVNRAEALLLDKGMSLAGARILILGTAYKANVGDIREAPAFDVVSELLARGAYVKVCDPHVTNWTRTPVVSIEDLHSEIGTFQLSILVTDHKAFDYNKIRIEADLVLDCRNAFQSASNVVPL